MNGSVFYRPFLNILKSCRQYSSLYWLFAIATYLTKIVYNLRRLSKKLRVLVLTCSNGRQFIFKIKETYQFIGLVDLSMINECLGRALSSTRSQIIQKAETVVLWCRKLGIQRNRAKHVRINHLFFLRQTVKARLVTSSKVTSLIRIRSQVRY